MMFGARLIVLVVIMVAGIVRPARANESMPQAVPKVRDLLDLLGIKPAQFSAAAAEPFALEGDDSLWRWLYAAKRCSLEYFDRWKLAMDLWDRAHPSHLA